ncbi:MAG: zinc ribbon domain-containing protein [Clostridia bacterium]|nr:zinc ribbon domain-containing protein [Clostridia bacterium]
MNNIKNFFFSRIENNKTIKITYTPISLICMYIPLILVCINSYLINKVYSFSFRPIGALISFILFCSFFIYCIVYNIRCRKIAKEIKHAQLNSKVLCYGRKYSFRNPLTIEIEKITPVYVKDLKPFLYDVCIFDCETQSVKKLKENINTIQFPPEKYADNDTYYAVETFRDEKKVRIYYTKERWEKQRKENSSLEVTIVDDKVKRNKKSHKEQGAVFCRKCGAKILIDSIFCSKCGTKVEEVNKNYFVCIFDTATHTLCKEKKNIDVTKFPPSKFADNDTYYAIETFREGKKVRIYHTKDNWNKQIEIGISEEEK